MFVVYGIVHLMHNCHVMVNGMVLPLCGKQHAHLITAATSISAIYDLLYTQQTYYKTNRSNDLYTIGPDTIYHNIQRYLRFWFLTEWYTILNALPITICGLLGLQWILQKKKFNDCIRNFAKEFFRNSTIILEEFLFLLRIAFGIARIPSGQVMCFIHGEQLTSELAH